MAKPWRTVKIPGTANESASKVSDYLAKMTTRESRDSKIIISEDRSDAAFYILTYSKKKPT